MNANTMQTVQRTANRACELLRAKTRHAEVLEQQLHRLMARLGVSSAATDITEEIDPLHGPNLRTPGSYAAVRQTGGQARPEAAEDDWWPTERSRKTPLKPFPGFAHASPDSAGLRTIGFIATGIGRDALDAILDRIDASMSENGRFSPIFLYDGFDFDLFRSRGWVLEWIPPAEDRARIVGARSWDDYLAERMRLLARKWGVAAMIPLTAGIDEAADIHDGASETADVAPQERSQAVEAA
ncbi:MAG: hypothetical protein ACK4WC_09905 [Rubrimonas sp.]